MPKEEDLEALKKRLKNLQVRNRNLKEKLDDGEKDTEKESEEESKEKEAEEEKSESEETEETGEEQAEETEEGEEETGKDLKAESKKEPEEKALPEIPTPQLTQKQLKAVIIDLSSRLSKVESYLFRVI